VANVVTDSCCLVDACMGYMRYMYKLLECGCGIVVFLPLHHCSARFMVSCLVSVLAGGMEWFFRCHVLTSQAFLFVLL